MEGGRVDTDAPLDYAAFQIFPAENRYEAFVHSGNKVEKLATGAVEQLLPHFPEVKNLYLKGSDAKFMLQPPKNLNYAAWFTKSTLNRFLSIVSSADLINSVNGIKNEMCQLEETRKFQLSLYARGRQDGSGSRETDGSDLTNVASSDASKNELLRAMDLRLTALRKELAAAFDQAMGPTCSEEITDLTEFSHHFGAAELEDCLRKFLELNQDRNIPDHRKDNKTSCRSDTKNVKLNKPDVKTQISKPVHSVDAVKYGVSPAKLAEVERESSIESDGSSDQSDDEEQKSVERSRTLIRSASPRRSASPMRRVQIGRSGSRRATAITIKSLNLFPARERTSHGDSSDEDGGGIEQPSKKTEGHVRRMSVADAISLFERKQNDQATDTQKGSSTNIAVPANKSVLRRWSTGLGESSTRAEHEIASEDSFPANSNNEESPKISAEAKSESDFTSKGHNYVEAAEEVKPEISEKKNYDSIDDQAETNTSQPEEINEKVTTSSEWSRQKEAELNQMLMKMMETKPTKYKKLQNSKTQNRPSEQRGGFYDHYKEKRDEKLRGENAGKRAEKEAQVKAMLQILDKRKTQIASSNASDGKKNPTRKPQKSLSNVSQPANPKKETTQKPTVAKKVPSRSQSVPATRKSWPSTPSPRNMGTPTARTSSPGTVPARRKPNSTPSVPQASPKVEKPLQQQRNVKKPETSNSKSLKAVSEKKQQPVAKPGKPMKSKVAAASGDGSSIAPTKPSLYNKVTKKSSVVPLESKPFLRKGSKTPPGAGSTVEKPKKNPRLSDESLRKSGNFVEAQENLIVTDSISIPVTPNKEVNTEAPIFCDATVEAETTEVEVKVKVKDSHLDSDEAEVIDEVVASNDDSFKDVAESSPKGQDDDDDEEDEEESTISPMAWVEIEEQHELPKVRDVGAPELTSTATNGALIGSSSPMRVRHSLSQMLQEESSEHDIIEWGNAENPPAMIYHKDAPKGLKRLLKFAARKSKGDANSSGWSSPSVFSEGEDDAEETKAASKRNGENLLRKAALHAAMNQGPPKASLHEGLEKNSDSYEFLSAESNTSKFNAHKFHDSVSGSGPSAKATRSFFSLSAFRGSSNKPNETKLR